MKKNIIPALWIVLIFFSKSASLFGQGTLIEREAKDTITPIEMNKGDTLKFKLRNGEVRTIILKNTEANVMITNLNELKKNQPGGAMLYNFTSKIMVDGHPMKMIRYVGSQASFYKPYVINGIRIWFDGVTNISRILSDIHGGPEGCGCLPHKDARFAITDMTDKIAPVNLHTSYDTKKNYLDIANSYNADDPWMGPYMGVQIHGGLDLNQPAGNPNFTPFAIDDHYFFNSLAKGDNNNRWRGIHHWDNGDVWTIQNHHMLNLLVSEHTPIKEGIHYSDAAAVHTGAHHHAHYVFKVKTPEDDQKIWLDPWILFWQAFESNKKRAEKINANISPLSPHITGETVTFQSKGSRSGVNSGAKLSYYWTFGDGGWSNKANPQHTYSKPGIYPVTLVVDDGAHKDSFTQNITINGNKEDTPALSLMSKDEPSFRIRPVYITDIYGKSINFIPHSLYFFARASRPKPDKKVVLLQNKGSGVLFKTKKPKIFYFRDKGWLSIQRDGTGNNQKLIVGVDATDLAKGVYTARVKIESPGSINGVQGFIVKLTIPTYPPADKQMNNVKKVIIDQSDKKFNRFYHTPYFWVRPQFKRWIKKGYKKNYYFTNGGRAKKGEYARFRPDLEAGTYEVSFAKETPFDPKRRAMSREGQQPVNSKLNPDSHFAVRVHSKKRDQKIWMEPAKSKIIGTFNFSEGMDGFVDILAGGSMGQVLVDALVFRKIE